MTPDPGFADVVSVSIAGEVCIWNADNGYLVFGPLRRHPEGALAVTFTPSSTDSAISPDGKWIAALAENLVTVHVWDSTTGQLTMSFEEQTDRVGSVTFSPDSERILFTSHDKTVRIHTLTEGMAVRPRLCQWLHTFCVHV